MFVDAVRRQCDPDLLGHERVFCLGGMYVQSAAAMLGWSDGQLDAEHRDIEIASRALEARRAACVAACETRHVSGIDGHRSLQAYVRATTNQPGAIAHAQVRRARFCRRFPAAGEALWAGHVGVAQVDALARLAANPRVGALVDEELVAMFLEHAEHFSARDLGALIDRWLLLADADGPRPGDVDDRNASVHEVDGRLCVNITGGDSLTTERVRLIFDSFCEAEYRHDLELRRRLHGDQADLHALQRSDRQRRFDAFVAMCDSAAAHAPVKPADACVNVLIDAKTLSEAFAQTGITLPDGDVFDPADSTGRSVSANRCSPSCATRTHCSAGAARRSRGSPSIPRSSRERCSPATFAPFCSTPTARSSRSAADGVCSPVCGPWPRILRAPRANTPVASSPGTSVTSTTGCRTPTAAPPPNPTRRSSAAPTTG